MGFVWLQLLSSMSISNLLCWIIMLVWLLINISRSSFYINSGEYFFFLTNMTITTTIVNEEFLNH